MGSAWKLRQVFYRTLLLLLLLRFPFLFAGAILGVVGIVLENAGVWGQITGGLGWVTFGMDVIEFLSGMYCTRKENQVEKAEVETLATTYKGDDGRIQKHLAKLGKKRD